MDRQLPSVSPSRKSTRGVGGTVRCSCARHMHLTKEIISRGLRLIRTRFSLPRGELPELGPSELDKYLLFQLNGAQRRSVNFPRSQHGWTGPFPNLQRLGRFERWELAHSCASIKRSLPSLSCRKHPPASSWDKWTAKAQSLSPPRPHPDYLCFARKEARRIFKYGWDRSYPSFCESFSPKHSSREDRCKSDLWWSKAFSKREFLACTMAGRPLPLPPFKMRFKDVPSVGKVRPMGVPTQRWDILGPLHKSLYDFISTKEWLLSCTADSKRIKKVCTYKYQTSVDLVSATDGLFIPVAEAILGVALAKSKFVPGWICQQSMESLRPLVRGAEVTHGQMMGCYLSFPLLCLQSYIAARWAARDTDANILVNGDDTIISSRDPPGPYPEGFELNEKKTMSALNAVEINSTVFLREGRRGWREVKHLRRGGFQGSYSGLVHAASVCKSAGVPWVTAFARLGDARRWKLGPAQLGLPLTNHACYRWHRTLFFQGVRSLYTELRPKLKVPDRYRVVRKSEISEDEQIAFRYDLFDNAREAPSLTKFEPSRVQVLSRVRYYRGPVPRQHWTMCTFTARCRENKKKEEIAFVPSWYESRSVRPSGLTEEGLLVLPLATWW
jgi:hypothetical protein